jgi:SecD/SecF fusion protein
MEKRKNWQLYLIIAVFVLTIYNILPTIFYYSNNLQAPISQDKAKGIATAIVDRVDALEEDAVEWIESFSKNLGVKPESITLKEGDPQLISVKLSNDQDTKLFKHFLQKAGPLIPFVPSQLELVADSSAQTENPHEVFVSRQIAIRLAQSNIDNLFHFSEKYTEDGNIAPFYQEVIEDRVSEITVAFGGASKEALQLAAIADNPTDRRHDEVAIGLAKDITEAESSLGKSNPILKRWFASFSQINRPNAKELPQKFLARLKIINSRVDGDLKTLTKEMERVRGDGEFVDAENEDFLNNLKKQQSALASAILTIEKNLTSFQAGQSPLTLSQISDEVNKGAASMGEDNLQSLSLEGRNPFIQSLSVDWDNDKLLINFFPDVQKIRTMEVTSESESYLRDKLNQYIINDIARGANVSDEDISPSGDTFAVKFSTLTNTQGILTFDLGALADQHSKQIATQLTDAWKPQNIDLNSDTYPIRNWIKYQKESGSDQKLGLVIYAPAAQNKATVAGFHNGSIYVIARGLASIENAYKKYPDSKESQQYQQDVGELQEIMKQSGFIAYPGNSYGIDTAFKDDYIFELDDFYANIMKASREDFTVHGSKKYAVLDLTNGEQRLLARNKIDDRLQEDLLKWKEEYDQAQVDLNPNQKFLIPPPTSNPYWLNFKLSAAKYFRGDDRKILKWGLDLSGGKTVRIGLRDQNGRPVTNPEDLNQAVNELYTRINKMGVSERTIRIENDNIILDFPGSQGLSASELIKASAMYFHIVNEKFAPTNTNLRSEVGEFLQNVWNEAVVTNKKDSKSINDIAWRHLGGDETTGEIHPKGEVAKLLYENGLRLANPADSTMSHAFDDTLSSIATLRGEDFSEWQGQTNPLIIVFHNYALEGASLTNVQVGYDPSDGNVLSFQVKGSYDKGGGNPRNDFYNWTSEFAEDQIKGTPKETYTKGRGWRMAVILNNKVISSPGLRAALRDGGNISGHFSQREIDQLAADLKAGSLSFTPFILSEQNVSPDLGKEERTNGIVASIIALSLVFVAMISYYRFAGVVASFAVLFNLLIMWGVLQNLGAALTLPGIAGIVLTIGMAVDANVLVFERIREEFKISGRIATAIQTGYRKAFSAIVDSNVTTILAAVILLQFDSGPIKGFAVTIIIGILSSMFTALFMTRYFFAGWVQNPKNKKLVMSEWIKETNFNFLKHTRTAVVISAILIIAGGYLFMMQKNSIFGMDFTGGYSLTLEVQDNPDAPESYRVMASNALLEAGVSTNDVDVRELSRPSQLKVQLGVAMEEDGQPFYGMPEDLGKDNITYQYQNNPRLNWVVNALEKGGLEIPESQLEQLDKNWTSMSGQFSDAMRNNALMALSFALISILAYITLRFEFKYAIAAVIALAHDVLITIGALAMFHALGFAVQINLEIVGALMTIIGYSLNDTIIIFDRIREDVHIYRKKKFSEVINHALNITLSRTLMTSGTTLLVLLTLVLLGGKAIFGFALVMTIGVMVGTVSSLFIASPVMLFFHNRELKHIHEHHETKPTKA